MSTPDEVQASNAALLADITAAFGEHAGRSRVDAVEFGTYGFGVFGTATLAFGDTVEFALRVPTSLANTAAAWISDLVNHHAEDSERHPKEV